MKVPCVAEGLASLRALSDDELLTKINVLKWCARQTTDGRTLVTVMVTLPNGLYGFATVGSYNNDEWHNGSEGRTPA